MSTMNYEYDMFETYHGHDRQQNSQNQSTIHFVFFTKKQLFTKSIGQKFLSCNSFMAILLYSYQINIRPSNDNEKKNDNVFATSKDT